eukprot:TRINITY_DN7924_c1_g1_i1.p1 TRINITY_DN7924_c1_g1~~TRINITY_DN7924_c1_g1_i1.p1  ORF type:complete len:616 (+),score=57.77 TRINITY_DN7924_c1_g1_i1:82-1929(+)
MSSNTIFSTLEIQSHIVTDIENTVDSNNTGVIWQQNEGKHSGVNEMKSCFNQETSIQETGTSKCAEGMDDSSKSMEVVVEEYNPNESNDVAVDNEHKLNKDIHNRLENQRNDEKHDNGDSFIEFNPEQQNQNKPQSRQSLVTYSKFILTLYKKAILLMIPFFILMLIVYLPLQFIKVTNHAGLIYTTATSVLSGIFYFFATWTVFYVVFDPIPIHKGILRIGVPWMLCNMVFNMLRNVVVKNGNISILYYLTCLIHHYWFLRSISVLGKDSVDLTTKDAMISGNKDFKLNRGQVLATNGTPMMFVKTLYIFLVFYFISIYQFVAYSLQPGTPTSMKIGTRLFIVPFILSLSEYIQTVLTRRSSAEYLKHCFIQLRITSLIHVVVLRFMVSNSKNIEEVAVITLFSCVSEIILRITYMQRFYLTKILFAYIKEQSNHFVSSLKHRSLNVNSRQEKNRPMVDNLVCSEEHSLNHTYLNGANLGSWKKFRTSFSRWRNSSEGIVVNSFYNHQTNKNLQNEIQAIIALSLVSYLLHPIRDYLLFKTTSSIGEILSSAGLQIVIEFITDIVCTWIRQDSIPVIELNLRRILWQSLYSLPSLTVAVFVTISSFMKNPEDYT